MRRILVLAAVVALMVVMLAMSVGPAFARGDQPYGGSCEEGLTNAYHNIGRGQSGNDKAPYRAKGPGQNHGMDTSEDQTHYADQCG